MKNCLNKLCCKGYVIVKKCLFIYILLFSTSLTMAQSLDDFNKSQQESVRKGLIQQGFPGQLLKEYDITQKNLPQLLRILAIMNSYGKSHNITLNYDKFEQEWYLEFKNHSPLYWAEARLIPKGELANKNQYRPYINYQWKEEPMDMRTWAPERLKRFEANTTPTAQRTRIVYHGEFHHLLYGGSSRIDVEEQLVRVNFLGTSFKINTIAAAALERVNRRIMQASQSDSSLKAFLATLSEPTSYVWRTIAGSNTVSFHSYGIAVDINPKRSVKPIYWQWERARNAQWYLVAPEDRWQIHQAVVQAFLDEGFLWGGIWPQYDIMHFEYRPELKELARLNQLFKLYLLDLNLDSR